MLFAQVRLLLCIGAGMEASESPSRRPASWGTKTLQEVQDHPTCQALVCRSCCTCCWLLAAGDTVMALVVICLAYLVAAASAAKTCLPTNGWTTLTRSGGCGARAGVTRRRCISVLMHSPSLAHLQHCCVRHSCQALLHELRWECECGYHATSAHAFIPTSKSAWPTAAKQQCSTQVGLMHTPTPTRVMPLLRPGREYGGGRWGMQGWRWPSAPRRCWHGEGGRQQ